MLFNNDYYYHVYNRGVEKRDIFLEDNDYKRFLTSIKEFNCLDPVGSLYDLKQAKDVGRPRDVRRLVDVVCYCLNPNHFHLLLKQLRAGGISEFVKRLSGGYTKYFNNKYSRSGALFQGKYKRKEIKTEGGFYKLTVYVNCNAEIHGLAKKEIWPWSSHKNFLKETSDVPGDVGRPGMDGLEYKKLCEALLPDIKHIKNLEKYGLE